MAIQGTRVVENIPEIAWPAENAFVPVRDGAQFTDGSAHCTRVAVANDRGVWTRRFYQGERAHFFFEFEVLRDIEFPAGGVELIHESGTVVHGKNTFQLPVQARPLVTRGAKLRFHLWFDLRVRTGNYKISLGLAGTDANSYEGYVNGPLPHAAFTKRVRDHCRVVRALTIEIAYAEDGKLTHHGLADLAGGGVLQVTQPQGAPAEAPTERGGVPGDWPTVFHITHWKAGSQWIYKILRECAPARIIEPQVEEAQVRYFPIQRGSIYPTVYVTKTEMDQISVPDGSKRFIVIRDLRDTLISAYFSFKISHPILQIGQAHLRETLCNLDAEDGMLHLLDHFLPACADLQLSWLDSGEPILKYEDLLKNDTELLGKVLSEHCGLPIERQRLEEIILANRFEAITHGRKRGTEDVTAHERKGIAGDWRNYFTARLKKAFKTRFGGLLVATGYENDLDW